MDRLTMFSLLGSNLRQKSWRTGVLAFIVALFCMTLFAGTIIGQKAGTGARLVGDRLGADILFVPYGYDAKVQSSLLRGEPSSFYMDRGLEEELRHEPGVGKVTSQLFMATFKASCCSLPVQLIGFDPENDFVVKPWMMSVLDRPLRENEVVVGRKIAVGVGETIRLLGKEFVIAARLDATGMGFDTSIFLELDRARRLLLLSELGPQLSIPAGLNRQTFVSSVLVKADPSVDVRALVNRLSEKYAIKYNLDFVVVATMITDIAGKLQIFSRMFYAFSGLLWVLAVIVLALVFSASIRERKREFGVLRTIGASRTALLKLVLGEAFAVSGAGALVGVGLALCLMLLFRTYIDVSLQLPSAGTDPGHMLFTAVCVFVPGVLTGPLACVPAIMKLGKLDTYLAMREEA